MSQVFRALSDPTRRRVLQLLRKAPVLKEADLVHAEKAGKSVIYHLKLSVLEEALLGFVSSFDLGAEAPEPKTETAK
jgi:DNA-binding transcriptional ArsR family regulator